MIEDWSKLVEIFAENDGSLPDIELNQLSGEDIVEGYEILMNHSGYISSEDPYYWSVSRQCVVPIAFKENPAELVISGEAEPFHICFNEIESPAGKRIPGLGLFVFSSSLALDYRMGPKCLTRACCRPAV